MRTNIVIDDQLMQTALRVTGIKTKKEVVELALRILLRLQQQEQLRSLRGKMDWQSNLEDLRRDQ